MCSVIDNTGTLKMTVGTVIIYAAKSICTVSEDGTNVSVRYSPTQQFEYPATAFTSPTGTAVAIAAAIGAMITGGGGGITPATIGNYAWALDGNTVGAEKWIGAIDNFALPIKTNNTERIRINATGEVGIGATSATGTTFTVKGSASSSSTYAVKVLNSSNANSILVRDDGGVSIGTTPDATTRLTIKTSGNGTATGAIAAYTSTGVDLFHMTDDKVVTFGHVLGSGSGYFMITNPPGQFRINSETHAFNVFSTYANSATNYGVGIGCDFGASGILGDTVHIYNTSANGNGIRIFQDNASGSAYLSLNRNAWGGNTALQLLSNGNLGNYQSGYNAILSNEASLMMRIGSSYNIEYFLNDTGTAFGAIKATGTTIDTCQWSFGDASPHASALADFKSIDKGVRMPNMTTAQKNAISSPAKGLIVYDTTLNKLCVYTTAWETITSV